MLWKGFGELTMLYVVRTFQTRYHSMTRFFQTIKTYFNVKTGSLLIIQVQLTNWVKVDKNNRDNVVSNQGDVNNFLRSFLSYDFFFFVQRISVECYLHRTTRKKKLNVWRKILNFTIRRLTQHHSWVNFTQISLLLVCICSIHPTEIHVTSDHSLKLQDPFEHTDLIILKNTRKTTAKTDGHIGERIFVLKNQKLFLI